ncbi:MAG: hypothetical protein ACRDNF_11055 [Streptosporangiaceae bacterium]
MRTKVIKVWDNQTALTCLVGLVRIQVRTTPARDSAPALAPGLREPSCQPTAGVGMPKLD